MAQEDELEEGKMPLLDHLIELRTRLLYAIVAWLAMFAPCWYFSKPIYNFLAKPLAEILAQQSGGHFIYTDLTEAFFTDLRVAFWASFCLAFPIIATQLWMFVAPGLYKNERRAFLPYLFATPVRFIIAAVLTPPDVFSMCSLAVPLLLLYEISIFSARIVEKRRAEREAAAEADLGRGASGKT